MSSLNATPAGERVHIGLFGKRNAGKSSLINALTGQKLAVVAEVPGTTTDPVLKAMELLPLGPVLMMDTAGIDDTGELGQLRVQKSLQVLNKTDIAVLVVPQKKAPFPICADLIEQEDHVLLVTPIDSAAPKGRLILPQQQTIRDIIDRGAVAVITKENNVGSSLENMKEPPVMVITDSQAFGKVNQAVPHEIKLTSFSILMARHKGNLAQAVLGVAALKQLQDGDRVLISEGCTHHRQCGDIGTEKLPKWIRDFTGRQFNFSWTSGTEFPADLSSYRLVIHCGGCMLNEREMQYRYRCAADQNVPMTNYGLCIAYIHGILKRSLSVFPDLAEKV